MSGYIGTKAVTLSTTAANVGGDSTVGGDLTVDTNTLYVDSTNNRVGIGNTAPTQALDVTGDIITSGGVYLGGTGAANLLDDYEEGTWTVSTTGLNGASVLNAKYTKIGNIVHADVRVSWTSTDGSGSGLQFNLPFTSAAASNGSSSTTAAAFYSGTSVFSGRSVVGHIGASTGFVSFYDGGGNVFSLVTRAFVNGAYNWLVSIVYQAA